MSVTNETNTKTTERPLTVHLPMWPLYLLLAAYVALWLLMAVASCSGSRTEPVVPAPTEEAIETSLIAPEPDEGRAP